MKPRPPRLITATALFDGHDVSINLFRSLLVRKGAEVIHLGHNRSVAEITTAALQEDADAVLISSYQGGHNEFFPFIVDSLREKGCGHVLVFGGGGGVILPSEIRALEAAGVCRLYHADTGRQMGLDGMAADILSRTVAARKARIAALPSMAGDASPLFSDWLFLSRAISFFEDRGRGDPLPPGLERALSLPGDGTLVLGITGTGGSGKSSLLDELVSRFLKISPDIRIAVLAVDPSKSKSGGALLGDRIRMNAVHHPRVFMRSLATRGAGRELSDAVQDAIRLLKAAAADLVLVETAGTGQGDHAIMSLADRCLYVMTAEYGSASQLEKIDMLELAHFIAINKRLKAGSEDALREVTLHYCKSRGVPLARSAARSLFSLDVPVYATESNRFNDPGVNALFLDVLKQRPGKASFHVDEAALALLSTQGHKDFSMDTGMDSRYLADIADRVERYRAAAEKEAALAQECQGLSLALDALRRRKASPAIRNAVRQALEKGSGGLSKATRAFLKQWPALVKKYASGEIAYEVKGKEIRVRTRSESLSGLAIPKVALPRYTSWAELTRFFLCENLPGRFPFTAGVFPFKRTTEDPRRQFAGEGSPEKTNTRLHYLCRSEKSKRLSIAFDPLTLYGEDPSREPDIYGKIGESGVSICTLDNMKALFKGFDLSDPMTSVSMTINGPSPIILAMYFITALQQAEEKAGRAFSEKERLDLFRALRGTVQADMLKEDQGQNSCIFSIEFALKMMGDVQQYFSSHKIRTYYTVSVSGYHIAEAGANPVTQLAFTLANGFHYVEHFLSLGLPVDDFAKNLSFFFSNGMEPEYSVIGRVARRIWAVAMRDRYGANERSQQLKYHVQTAGRTLHAREVQFNDIRTTLQALFALYDNCSSLHTNSYDEAITTPTRESVRRAVAIQLILQKEFGLLKNENPNQGSFIIEELTDLTEKAVLQEFRRIASRGGVLGAMERQYQRSKIQEESLNYEELKGSGAYPVIGVNTFVREDAKSDYDSMEVRRASAGEKESQLAHLAEFEKRNAGKAPQALEALRRVILKGGNIFEELLNTVQSVSLGKITRLLYEMGGRYRRNM